MEATVASILADINVDVDSNVLEAWHRFGKPERTTKSRNTIVRFTNRNYCKKALLNQKKLANLDNENHQLWCVTGSKQLCSVQLLRNFICWLFSQVTGLFWVVFLLWATSVPLRELNFEILERMISTKKKKTCSKSAFCLCFFFLSDYLFWNLRIDYLILCFYSTTVPLNVFRMSSSWLSL